MFLFTLSSFEQAILGLWNLLLGLLLGHRPTNFIGVALGHVLQLRSITNYFSLHLNFIFSATSKFIGQC